jgi:uncharacterized protein YgiM (DUF1202 family)
MKKFSLILTILILTCATVFANSNVIATYIVVNCRESITLRQDPSVYSPEITQIPLGQAVGFIEDVGNGFYKINYDGLTGYALAQYLSPQNQRTGTVANCRQSITLREYPSVQAGEILQIPLGARVEILDDAENEFYQVRYRGYVGYALKAYIRLN